MSSTNTGRKSDTIGTKAHALATGKWMTRLARLGYAVKGFVYLVIGWLAVELALDRGGKAIDQRGALETISSQAYGPFLLIIITLGLLGFGLWCFIQAIFDTENKGKEAKGIISRLGYAIVGVSYLLLALGAFNLILGRKDAGQSSGNSTQDWTALLLKQPFGQALVVIGGLGVLAVAGYLFYKAYKAPFRKRLTLTDIGAQLRAWVMFIGRFGYGALGVVFSIVGIFLIVAALQRNPGEAKGLDTALQQLSHEPFGTFLLIIVALGLLAYGLYSFVEARYRRVG